MVTYYVTDRTRKEEPVGAGFTTPEAAFNFYVRNCKADAQPLIWYRIDCGVWHAGRYENFVANSTNRTKSTRPLAR